MDDTSAPPNPGKKRSIPFLARIIATAFFSGYVPVASGTAGSLVGLLVYYLAPGMENPVVLCVVSIVTFGIGVPAAAAVARIAGNELTSSARMTKDLFQPDAAHAADPSIVVIDEVVGMWVSLLFLPKGIVVALAAFVAFRAFDIVKPFPARHVERYPNGWGIMLDDVFAGVYANIIVQVLVHLFPKIFT
ncbi:MAG: phosphatidylglycerophosphatase A [Ignavibacteriae bacterium]|nr:phosphatidylglycerophosphatase A [Ignavibacteria bacterium]MBI3363988.1 phosphatidylglycerophosphatase A [Ignavibacteriota bacterium]